MTNAQTPESFTPSTMAQAAIPSTIVRNGRAVPLGDVPILRMDDFRRRIIESPSLHRRVVALFGVGEPNQVKLYCVLAGEGQLHVFASAVEGDTYPSMTGECPQVHLFEREIFEQWGVRPEGHPWLKPVRFGDSRRATDSGTATIGIMPFYQVEGEEVHEVAVGPVHAGVIEPGHFRFQCHGEEVLHLEISLGYQHRGIEQSVLAGPSKRVLPYMETVAGDTSIGHTSAHCQAIEGLSETSVSARAYALRAIALELERLANHVGGLGALANDIGYLPTASFCGRLRGDFLNLTAALCGSRFGRGLVRLGGVGFDVTPEQCNHLALRLDATQRDVKNAVSLLWEANSVQARFEGTGALTQQQAEQLGLVGVAARACGLERDVRHDFPAGFFQLAQIPVSVAQSGDVFGRAYVRWLEVQRSYAFIREQLQMLPSGAILRGGKSLLPNRLCVSLVEGWRGEICHIAMTNSEGQLSAYKIVDPSFHNWMGLAIAMRSEQISDFPLCNKSFDLSYCGHDL